MNVDEYFKRIDTTKICPWFLSKCKELVANCAARGVYYYALSGYRDPLEQDALYAIGRTVELDKKPVTNARGFTSFHNYAIAIDFCADKDAVRAGLQPDWDLDSYKVLQEEAHKLGLITGLDFTTFKEGPHVQIPFIAGATGTYMKLFKEKGIESCWEYALSNLKSNSIYKRFY